MAAFLTGRERRLRAQQKDVAWLIKNKMPAISAKDAVVPIVLPQHELQRSHEWCSVAKFGHDLTKAVNGISELVSNPLNDNEWDFEELSCCFDEINVFRDTMLAAIKRRSAQHRLAVENSATLEASLERRRRAGCPSPLTTRVGDTLFMADNFAVPEIPLSRDGWTVVLSFMGISAKAALCSVSKACCAAVMYDVKEINVELSSRKIEMISRTNGLKVSDMAVPNFPLLAPNCRQFNVILTPDDVWSNGIHVAALEVYLRLSLRRIYGASGVSLRLTYKSRHRGHGYVRPTAAWCSHLLRDAWDGMLAQAKLPVGAVIPFKALVVDNFNTAMAFLVLSCRRGPGSLSMMAPALIIDIDSAYGRRLPDDRDKGEIPRVSMIKSGHMPVFVSRRMVDKRELRLWMAKSLEPDGSGCEFYDAAEDITIDTRGSSELVISELHCATALTEYAEIRIGDPRGRAPEEWAAMERQPSLWHEPDIICERRRKQKI